MTGADVIDEAGARNARERELLAERVALEGLGADPPPEPPGDPVLVGYAHASMMDSLRPDLAYPDRKVRATPEVMTAISARPCACHSEHVEIWARKIPKQEATLWE
jgi:hypothetical protein